MSIEARYYRDMIVRAVLGADPAMTAVAVDPATLNSIVNVLVQAEAAKTMLCAKGYGISAQAIDDVARAVPDTMGL